MHQVIYGFLKEVMKNIDILDLDRERCKYKLFLVNSELSDKGEEILEVEIKREVDDKDIHITDFNKVFRMAIEQSSHSLHISKVINDIYPLTEAQSKAIQCVMEKNENETNDMMRMECICNKYFEKVGMNDIILFYKEEYSE